MPKKEGLKYYVCLKVTQYKGYGDFNKGVGKKRMSESSIVQTTADLVDARELFNKQSLKLEDSVHVIKPSKAETFAKWGFYILIGLFFITFLPFIAWLNGFEDAVITGLTITMLYGFWNLTR